MLQLTRRGALLGLTSAFALGRASLALAAAATEQRFIVVILRGALDGMSAVVPHGDPALVELRGELVPDGLLDLGGFYGLHPSLANLHAMYQAGELLPVHAVAGPTRVRSHFEAQDCLESGADHRMTSGWLNRAVAAMPAAASGRPEGDALAIGVSVPCCCEGRPRSATGRRMGSFPLARPLHADCRAKSGRQDNGSRDRRGSARTRLHRCGPG